MSRQDDATSSFSFPSDVRRAEIVDSKPVSSSPFRVVVDGRSVSGSTRVDVTQVVISGVKLPSPPSSVDAPPSSS